MSWPSRWCKAFSRTWLASCGVGMGFTFSGASWAGTLPTSDGIECGKFAGVVWTSEAYPLSIGKSFDNGECDRAVLQRRGFCDEDADLQSRVAMRIQFAGMDTPCRQYLLQCNPKLYAEPASEYIRPWYQLLAGSGLTEDTTCSGDTSFEIDRNALEAWAAAVGVDVEPDGDAAVVSVAWEEYGTSYLHIGVRPDSFSEVEEPVDFVGGISFDGATPSSVRSFKRRVRDARAYRGSVSCVAEEVELICVSGSARRCSNNMERLLEALGTARSRVLALEPEASGDFSEFFASSSEAGSSSSDKMSMVLYRTVGQKTRLFGASGGSLNVVSQYHLDVAEGFEHEIYHDWLYRIYGARGNQVAAEGLATLLDESRLGYIGGAASLGRRHVAAFLRQLSNPNEGLPVTTWDDYQAAAYVACVVWTEKGWEGAIQYYKSEDPLQWLRRAGLFDVTIRQSVGNEILRTCNI